MAAPHNNPIRVLLPNIDVIQKFLNENKPVKYVGERQEMIIRLAAANMQGAHDLKTVKANVAEMIERQSRFSNNSALIEESRWIEIAIAQLFEQSQKSAEQETAKKQAIEAVRPRASSTPVKEANAKADRIRAGSMPDEACLFPTAEMLKYRAQMMKIPENEKERIISFIDDFAGQPLMTRNQIEDHLVSCAHIEDCFSNEIPQAIHFFHEVAQTLIATL